VNNTDRSLNGNPKVSSAVKSAAPAPPALIVNNNSHQHMYTNGCRRSASMESIPSVAANNHHHHNHNQQSRNDASTKSSSNADKKASYSNQLNSTNNTNTVVNIHNKYGTIGGYSMNSTKTNRPSVLTHSNTTNLPLTSNNTYQQHVETSATSDSITNNNSSSGVNLTASDSLGNSRLRAVNRSFRTAVDKSFDVPNNSSSSNNANQQQQQNGNANNQINSGKFV
jgi:hypothetical protein